MTLYPQHEFAIPEETARVARAAYPHGNTIIKMRDALGMTDGNLTTHIRTLQEAGYIAVAKSFQNNRPHTTCSLTPPGKKAFTNYINLLEAIIQQNKPK